MQFAHTTNRRLGAAALRRWALVGITAGLLSACGGGGGEGGGAGATTQQTSGNSGATVAGLYFGTASGGRTLDALLMPDGRVYAMLGVGAGITSVFFGNGTPTATGLVTSAGGNMATRSGNPLVPGELTLVGVPRASISGSLSSADAPAPATFTSTYSAAFEGTPVLANLAGKYEGDSAGLGRVINATLTIDGAGNLSGTSVDGCVHSGSLTPHASANIFELRITFGTACPRQGTLTGHALWSRATTGSAATLTLFAAASEAGTAFAQGWVYFGSRP